MTLSESSLSVSLCVDEVTVVAVALADGAPPMALDSCSELELGAHVARMHTVSPRASATLPDHSPRSSALASA